MCMYILCMYVLCLFVCSILLKTEKIHTVEENKQNDKAHDAIALQLVEAPYVHSSTHWQWLLPLKALNGQIQ